MAGPINAFYGALRDVFGPAKTTHTDWTVASGGSASLIASAPAALLNQGPGRIEVYSLDLIASAAAAGTFQLIDATATGIGGTVVWGTVTLLPTMVLHDFFRPLYFTKGLVQSYTATSGSLSANVQWSGVAGG